MLKPHRLTLGFVATLLAGVASAQTYVTPNSFKSQKMTRSGQTEPDATYQGQWWTHPLGCEYSRAGLPGEIVWYIIINTARRGCPQYIVTKSHSGVY
jgi:hypothetical protein